VPVSSSMWTSLDSPKQQEDVALKAHVVSVCSKCFTCLIYILQVFHVMLHMLPWLYMYIASVLFQIFNCFKRMLQVFYLDVAYVSHIYCRCFIWILHMFCNGYTRVFLMFQTYVASVSFRCYKSRSSVAHVIMGPSVATACYS
jgi:hypothetical protein